MSTTRRRKQRKEERFERKFNAMNISRGVDDEEIYNVMVDRLSRAIEDGHIDTGKSGMDDTIKSHREQAHILLQKATNKLTKKVTFSDASHGGGENKAHSTTAASTKSHTRQQAADWAKANAGAMQENPKYNRGGRRSSGQSSPRQVQKEDNSSDDYDYDYAYDDDEESDTEQEINTTRALLEEAASRLKSGGTNLDGGIHNIIYSRLMEELGLKPASGSSSRSQQRAAAAAGLLTTTMMSSSSSSKLADDPTSQAVLRARREYAASMLSENKNKPQSSASTTTTTLPPLSLPNPLAPPIVGGLERRNSAMEILKNLHQKQDSLNTSRRNSNPDHRQPPGKSKSGPSASPTSRSSSVAALLSGSSGHSRRSHDSSSRMSHDSASSSKGSTGNNGNSSSHRSPRRHKSDPRNKR